MEGYKQIKKPTSSNRQSHQKFAKLQFYKTPLVSLSPIYRKEMSF